MGNRYEIAERRDARLGAPSPLSAEHITTKLNALLADVFALYLKTKSFHWHINGPHLRECRLLLDEQADQILTMTDDIAERVRKLGGTTIRSIGEVARLKHVRDNDSEYVEPFDMLRELREDNQALVVRMILIQALCDEANDVATASILGNWIDQTQRRAWSLFERDRTRGAA